MQQHLVGRKVLLHDVLSVHGDDRDAEEEVEVVRLVVRPAGLPHAQRVCLRKLALEAQQDPSENNICFDDERSFLWTTVYVGSAYKVFMNFDCSNPNL